MKIYKKNNVFEEALERTRRIFEEFENVVVTVSGGKDSTVVFYLSLIVAREMNRLPLKVMFIDQEAEWQATIDLIDKWFSMDEVEPLWYQIPIKLFNATSHFDDWLYCWNEADKDKWIRPKRENAITENIYGTDRFKELFQEIPAKEWPDKKTAMIAGVRTEESPARFLGMINALTYKDISWGKKHRHENHYDFYPIYDWSYTDVWKAIQENNWLYNRIYDKQYQLGVSVMDMRVSNLHHETAVWSLFYLQEAEPDTYNKLIRRLNGISSATKFGEDDYFVNKLPFMFKNWKEYRNYLLEHLIDEEHQEDLLRKMEHQDDMFEEYYGDKLHRRHVSVILANDWTGTKLKNIEVSFSTPELRKKYKEKKNAL